VSTYSVREFIIFPDGIGYASRYFYGFSFLHSIEEEQQKKSLKKKTETVPDLFSTRATSDRDELMETKIDQSFHNK
jgi:hypothetical protein